MHRAYLLDRRHRSTKAALVATLTILVLGLGLGAAVGMALARGFDAMNLEQRARDFSNPGAAVPADPGTLQQ
jgi:hypothetical protein